VRDEFRQVERLRGMKCFPCGETQFVGNMMTNTHTHTHTHNCLTAFGPGLLG